MNIAGFFTFARNLVSTRCSSISIPNRRPSLFAYLLDFGVSRPDLQTEGSSLLYPSLEKTVQGHLDGPFEGHSKVEGTPRRRSRPGFAWPSSSSKCEAGRRPALRSRPNGLLHRFNENSHKLIAATQSPISPPASFRLVPLGPSTWALTPLRPPRGLGPEEPRGAHEARRGKRGR